MTERDCHASAQCDSRQGSICEISVETDRYGMPCCALKRLQSQWSGHPLYRRAVAREASILALLDRPGLPQLLAADVDAPQPWLRYRWMAGQSVAARGRGAGSELARTVARDLLAHVSYLHEQVQCVHGDIAASNVLLHRHSGHVAVALLDFGNAWLMTSPWRRRPQMAYCAPEQADRSAWSAKADVFQVGIVVHEILTGTRPAMPTGVMVDAQIPEPWRESLSAMLDPVATNRPDARTARELVPDMRLFSHGPCGRRPPRNKAADGQMEVAG